MGKKMFFECLDADLSGLNLQVLLEVAEIANDETRRVSLDQENLFMLSRKYNQPSTEIWEIIINLSKAGFITRFGEYYWIINKPPTDGKVKIRKNFPPATPSPKYVYVIEALGRFKIGVTGDIQARIKTIQTTSPGELQLICYFETDDAYELEKELHQKFEKKRIQGEWFELTTEDLNYLTGGTYAILL